MSEQRNSESLLGAYWMLGLTDERWLPSGKVLADMGAALKVEKPGGNIAIGPIYKVTRDPLLPLVIPHQSQQARHHLQPGYSTWRKALREMVKTPASSPLIQVGASSVSAQRGLRNLGAPADRDFPGVEVLSNRGPALVEKRRAACPLSGFTEQTGQGG